MNLETEVHFDIDFYLRQAVGTVSVMRKYMRHAEGKYNLRSMNTKIRIYNFSFTKNLTSISKVLCTLSVCLGRGERRCWCG